MGLKDYFNTGDDLATVYIHEGNGRNRAAQVFTTGSDYSPVKIKIKLYKSGNPGNVVVTINEVSAGVPTSTVLATADTRSANGFTTNTAGLMEEFVFSTPPDLNTATPYAIILSCAGANDFNQVRWRGDSSSPSYSGGQYCTSTNVGTPWTWTGVSGTDLTFETYNADNLVYAEGDIVGGFVFSGATNKYIFDLVSGTIAIMGSFVGNITKLVTRVPKPWPQPRPATIADDDTLHNNTLIAVGFDANGLGIIYFKET